MEKVNIFIVEDNFIIAEDLKETLLELGYSVCAIASSYSKAIDCISQYQPDIAIIDIMLPGNKTGIDIGLHIREHYDFPFIYLSSHTDKETVLKASESLPNAYLVKPFKAKELFTTIEIALRNYSKKQESPACNEQANFIFNDSIFIKKDNSFLKVKTTDITYLKSEGNYLEVSVSNKQKFVIRSSIKGFLSCLPSGQFLRIHNSYVVNLEYITKVTYTAVVIDNHELPISKNRRDDVMKQMNIYS